VLANYLPPAEHGKLSLKLCENSGSHKLEIGRRSEADVVEKGKLVNPGLGACHHPPKHGAGNLQVGKEGLCHRAQASVLTSCLPARCE